jgi:hypothetical protein
MSLRRALALVIAILAIALLVSIPFLVASHLRESSRNSLGGVANGTVVAVSRDGRDFTMVVEFHVTSSAAPRRLRWPAETIGFLRPRARQHPGDPVLVAYDPRHPEVARVFDVRPVWTSIMRRAFLAALLLIAALLLFRAGNHRMHDAEEPLHE